MGKGGKRHPQQPREGDRAVAVIEVMMGKQHRRRLAMVEDGVGDPPQVDGVVRPGIDHQHITLTHDVSVGAPPGQRRGVVREEDVDIGRGAHSPASRS